MKFVHTTGQEFLPEAVATVTRAVDKGSGVSCVPGKVADLNIELYTGQVCNISFEMIEHPTYSSHICGTFRSTYSGHDASVVISMVQKC